MVGWFLKMFGLGSWSKGLEDTSQKIADKQVDKVLAKLEAETTKLYTVLEPILSTAQTTLSTGTTTLSATTRFLTAGTIIAYAVGFAKAVSSLVHIYKVLQGTDATSALMKLGVSIDKSLRTAAESLEAMNARGSQDKFGKHVYRYAQMMAEHSPSDDYYFVFHPGTDWYPRFNEMNKQDPIPGYAGHFSNFYTMLIFLHVFRRAAGVSARINVIIPAEHWVYLEKPISVDKSLAPIQFHGQKHASGRPYVHVNMPGVPNDIFTDIENVAKAPQSIGKWMGSNVTGWAVGVPTTAATILGACIMGALCPPLLLVGVAASPVPGYFAGAAARDAVYDHMVQCEEKKSRKGFSMPSTT